MTYTIYSHFPFPLLLVYRITPVLLSLSTTLQTQLITLRTSRGVRRFVLELTCETTVWHKKKTSWLSNIIKYKHFFKTNNNKKDELLYLWTPREQAVTYFSQDAEKGVISESRKFGKIIHFKVSMCFHLLQQIIWKYMESRWSY